MTEQQHRLATSIQADIKSIESELRALDRVGGNGVKDPLTLRMAGVLEHVPPRVFLEFRSACIAGMNKKLEELNAEFDRL